LIIRHFENIQQLLGSGKSITTIIEMCKLNIPKIKWIRDSETHKKTFCKQRWCGWK